MNNEMLTTIDEDTLDGVAGGGPITDFWIGRAKERVEIWKGIVATHLAVLGGAATGASEAIRKTM